MQRGKVTASVWMDNKPVTVMSTNTQPSATGSVLRRQRDGSRISVPCPEAILCYNSHMGGVDRGDQLRGYYSCRTKSRKFYKYIFYFLFDTTITNSFILWKTFGSATRMTLKEFRLRLAQQLIGDYCSRRKPGRAGGPVRTLPLRHFPLKLDDDTTGANKRGRCVRCLQVHHKRTDTTWFCRECQEWLCHSGTSTGDCFLLWHKNRT